MRMKLTLPIILEKWSDRYWIIPSLIAIAISLLLPLMISLDRKILHAPLAMGMLRGYSPAGARLILSSICTAVMTVIGVIFSITIVVIQQASNQFSPRIVEIYIRSRTNQVILGLYVGTFIYGILLLRLIPSNTHKIPQSAVTVGIVLALVCISVLVHYVHFIAHLIRSTRIVESIGKESLRYLRQYLKFVEDYAVDGENWKDISRFTREIRAHRAGYFQSYLPESIDKALSDQPTEVKVLRRPGTFVLKNDVLFQLHSELPLSAKACEKVREAISIGAERTHVQDVSYGIRQLADIALRGLSPGYNDPTTAIEALNSIHVLLCEWLETIVHRDSLVLAEGTRFKILGTDFEELLKIAFSQVLMVSGKHFQVLEKIEEILRTLGQRARREEDAALVSQYFQVVSKMKRTGEFSEVYVSDNPDHFRTLS